MSRRPLPSSRGSRITLAVALLVVLAGTATNLGQPGPLAGDVARGSLARPVSGSGGGQLRLDYRREPSEPSELRVSRARSRLFRIGGRLSGQLAPGVSVPLDLVLSNPHAYPVFVMSLTVRVRRIRAPRADAGHRCTVRDFAVARFSGRPFKLRPASSARLKRLGIARWRWPRVRMRDRPVNQDGCKGASLRLEYRGTGRR